LLPGARVKAGFYGRALAYPAKLAFPMLFYFLDLKRSAELASRTYLFGYLVCYATQSRAGDGSLLDLHGAQDVNEAIQVVSSEGPIKPLVSAFDGTFRQSKRALRAGAALLAGKMRQLAGLALPEQVAEAIAQIESDEEREIEPVVTSLQNSIASVPDEYFRALRTQLDTCLGSLPHVVSSGTDLTNAG
jgi:hypothetical protein